MYLGTVGIIVSGKFFKNMWMWHLLSGEDGGAELTLDNLRGLITLMDSIIL